MPAQLDPPSSGPWPLLLAGPSTMGRRSGGSVLVCLPPSPHFFHFPVLFVSLALGVGGCYNSLAFRLWGRLPLDWPQL